MSTTTETRTDAVVDPIPEFRKAVRKLRDFMFTLSRDDDRCRKTVGKLTDFMGPLASDDGRCRALAHDLGDALSAALCGVEAFLDIEADESPEAADVATESEAGTTPYIEPGEIPADFEQPVTRLVEMLSNAGSPEAGRELGAALADVFFLATISHLEGQTPDRPLADLLVERVVRRLGAKTPTSTLGVLGLELVQRGLFVWQHGHAPMRAG